MSLMKYSQFIIVSIVATMCYVEIGKELAIGHDPCLWSVMCIYIDAFFYDLQGVSAKTWQSEF